MQARPLPPIGSKNGWPFVAIPPPSLTTPSFPLESANCIAAGKDPSYPGGHQVPFAEEGCVYAESETTSGSVPATANAAARPHAATATRWHNERPGRLIIASIPPLCASIAYSYARPLRSRLIDHTTKSPICLFVAPSGPAPIPRHYRSYSWLYAMASDAFIASKVPANYSRNANTEIAFTVLCGTRC
jgi:hypothetical protein